MDLMLSNFIVDDQAIAKEKRTNHESITGKGGGGGTGFSMTFDKAMPRKAVVARKRPLAKVAAAPVESNRGQKPNLLAINQPKKPSQPEQQQKHSSAQPQDDPVKVKSTKNSYNNKPNGTAKNSADDSSKLPPGVPTVTKPAEHKAEKKSPEGKGVWNFKNDSVGSTKQAAYRKTTNIFDQLKTALPKIDLPRVKPLEEQVFSDSLIEELEIHPHTKKNITDLLGYTRLTMVQSMGIPPLMEGRDALIRAQTGSGKTLAYALPLIEKLHTTRPKTGRSDGILAVVIVPTRELALQTYEILIKLLKPYTWIVSGYLCGGEKRKTEKARLRAGLNILVGTPGRFCDHIRNTESLKLNNVRWLVLDEADRLLELGYEKDVKDIVSAIQGGQGSDDDDGNDSERNGTLQTVLLSATLTTSVKELAGLTLHNPVYVETSDAIRKREPHVESNDGTVEFVDHLLNVDECVIIPSTVKQCYLVVPPKLRLVTLSGLIAHEQHKRPSKALVFMATQDLVDFHYDVMVEVLTTHQLDSDDEQDEEEEPTEPVLLPRVNFYKLHGGMTQVERSSVFQRFRKDKAAVLLCTDMVARGIDIPCVDLVVQYHAPQILADYVHRVGRTARAGQTGKAVLFVEPVEVDFIKYLAEKQIRIKEQKIDGIFVHLGQQLKCGQKTIGKNKEKAAYVLQQRFEQLVVKEKELFSSASKAFVSWVRYYSNFPRELRRMFAIRAIHMGHYAQCLGLRDPPKQFMHEHTGPKRDGEPPAEGAPAHRRQQPHGARDFRPRTSTSAVGSYRGGGGGGMTGGVGRSLADFAKRSRVLNTSEFDSGLGPARKKAKQSG